MSSTQIRGLQIRLATIGRDRIDAAFEASLASIEANVANIFNTMSTDAERMAAIEAVTTAFQGADTNLQTAITSMVNAAKVGVGLEADGSFSLPVGQNYLTGATSVKSAVGLLDAALKTEADARIAGDAALQASITALSQAGAATAAADLAAAVAAQATKDAAQDAALVAETNRATTAEADLQTQITNEVNARTLLNTTLSTAIAQGDAAATAANSAEATTRAAAVNTLQANIDAEALARTTADGVHTASIAQEVADRAAAVQAEETARLAGDAALGARVTTLEANVAGNLTYDKYVNRETPVGNVDGTNNVFTLANVPYAGSESVYVNGMLQEPGASNDYQLVGQELTLTAAPLTGDRVKVTYFR